MILEIGQKYILEYIGMRYEITLIAIPKRNVTHYKWQHSDGRFFENREQDVSSWIRFGQIKKVEI